jgi:transposase
MKKYSADFKMSVVKFLKQDGNTIRSTAKTFSITTQTVFRWKHEFEKTGTFAPPPPRQAKQRKIDLDKLQEMVEKKPDMYQREMAAAFNVSRAGVQSALKKLKITRKKKTKYIRNETRSKGKSTWTK